MVINCIFYQLLNLEGIEISPLGLIEKGVLFNEKEIGQKTTRENLFTLEFKVHIAQRNLIISSFARKNGL